MAEGLFDTKIFIEKVLTDYPTISVADFRIDDKDVTFYTLRHPKEVSKTALSLVLFYDPMSCEVEYALDLLERDYGYTRCEMTKEICEEYGIFGYHSDEDDDEDPDVFEATPCLPRY